MPCVATEWCFIHTGTTAGSCDKTTRSNVQSSDAVCTQSAPSHPCGDVEGKEIKEGGSFIFARERPARRYLPPHTMESRLHNRGAPHCVGLVARRRCLIWWPSANVPSRSLLGPARRSSARAFSSLQWAGSRRVCHGLALQCAEPWRVTVLTTKCQVVWRLFACTEGKNPG